MLKTVYNGLCFSMLGLMPRLQGNVQRPVLPASGVMDAQQFIMTFNEPLKTGLLK